MPRDRELLSVDAHQVAAHTDGSLVPAVYGVEFEQVRSGRRVGMWVVDVDQLDVVAERPSMREPTDDEATDPAEPVYADANSHSFDARQSEPLRGEPNVN